MKRRSRTEILAQILELCLEKPKRVSDILFEVRILGGYYATYIKELVAKGLLVKTNTKYRTTDKGLEWLKRYKALKEIEG